MHTRTLPALVLAAAAALAALTGCSPGSSNRANWCVLQVTNQVDPNAPWINGPNDAPSYAQVWAQDPSPTGCAKLAEDVNAPAVPVSQIYHTLPDCTGTFDGDTVMVLPPPPGNFYTDAGMSECNGLGIPVPN